MGVVLLLVIQRFGMKLLVWRSELSFLRKFSCTQVERKVLKLSIGQKVNDLIVSFLYLLWIDIKLVCMDSSVVYTFDFDGGFIVAYKSLYLT